MEWPKEITKYGASKEKAEAYNQAIRECAAAISEESLVDDFRDVILEEWRKYERLDVQMDSVEEAKRLSEAIRTFLMERIGKE